jgi:hypothetical protein
MTPRNYLPAEHAEKRRNESKDHALLIFQREISLLFFCRCAFFPRVRQPLELDFGKVPEVHEQADFAACGVEVIDDLSTMLVGERGNGFEFDHDFIMAE